MTGGKAASSDERSALIRRARLDEYPLLATLIQAAFEEYRGRLDPPSGAHDETAERLEGRLSDGGAFLATAGEQPAGCVLFHLRADHCYLDRLSVLPLHRHRGIGRLLIAAVEDVARTSGLARVRLSVRPVLDGNRGMYARLGYSFHAHGTHEGYASPTYLILEKTL